MREVSFPLIEDLLEEKNGTLCVLSDPPGRLRDGMAVAALVQFCASRGVRLQIQQILAGHRRYVDARAVLSGLSAEQKQQINKVLTSRAELQDKIHQLFDIAERFRLKKVKAEEPLALEPRGPVIIIGRPQLYSKGFQDAIQAELPEGVGLIGRFEMAEPLAQGMKFWEVLDRYTNLTIPHPRGDRDLAVIRKVRGFYKRRTFLLVYGTSSLGTMAATQLLVDEDLNEDLSRANVAGALEKYGSAELLIQVDLETGPQRGTMVPAPHRSKMWTPEFEPRQIRLLAEPAPPVSTAVMRWIREFEADTQTDELQSVYKRVAANAHERIRYEVTGIHPQDKSERLGWFMVGGKKVGACVQSLRELAKAERRQPVLLAGSTGSGKELGARIVFQERILHLLGCLARNEALWPVPVVIGARFTEINCAKVTQTLAEAEYFGVREKSATDVIGRPGLILEAGEGVAFLDEISFMDLGEQAGLLRAVQPPYGVRSVGSAQEIPSAAQLVAAMCDDPDELVEARKLLPELCARFRPGIVRLPGLDERPGDIPALLAHLASGSIRLTRTVLCCLLAGSYPYNVRDLLHIVAKARSRHNTSGSLEITIEDLENPASYHRIVDCTSATSHTGNAMFEFLAPPPLSVRGPVFECAARALTAFATDTKGTMRPRWSEGNAGADLRASSYSITDIPGVAAALNDVLLLIMQEAPKAEQDDLLGLLAGLLEERYPVCKTKRARLTKMKELATHVLADLKKPPVEHRHVATAFGASDAWVSELVPRNRSRCSRR